MRRTKDEIFADKALVETRKDIDRMLAEKAHVLHRFEHYSEAMKEYAKAPTTNYADKLLLVLSSI